MATFYVKSGAGAADYNAAHTYSSGDKVVPAIADASSNFAVARKWVWECTTGGTTNGAASWPAAVTADTTTMTQNGVVFTARTPGFSSGTTANWAFATIYMAYATSAASTGDTVYVSNNHAETQSAAYTAIANVQNINVICVDDGAAPPTTLATTASVTTTGNSGLTTCVKYDCHVYGIQFIAGSGATGAASVVTAGYYDSCLFHVATSHASSAIFLSNDSVWINCNVKFGASGQGINGNALGLRWIGGALASGGTSPTTLFLAQATRIDAEGIDLTNAAAGINLNAPTGSVSFSHVLRNIKLPGSWSGQMATGVAPARPEFRYAVMVNGDSSGTNYVLSRRDTWGTLVQETTKIRTGGASDGTTGISWKMVSLSGALWPSRYTMTPEIAKWNATTGSAVTATIEILHDSATALKDDEIWVEVSYLSSAASPLGAMISDAKATFLTSAAAQTTSTATWTTTGLSNPNTQKLSVTFTPQLAGYVRAVVKLVKATYTVYVDPVITLS